MATPRALSNFLAMPPSLRCFALNQSIRYSSTKAPRPVRNKPNPSARATTPREPTTSRPATSRPTTPREPTAFKPATTRPATTRPATSRPATTRPATTRPAKPKPTKAAKSDKPVRAARPPANNASKAPRPSKSARPTSAPKPKKATKPIKPTSTPSTTPLSALSYHPPPSNDPNQRALASPVPHQTSLAAASSIFTSHPPRFLYSASRFLQIPSNNHTPEICLLGRSNVGKSTLINALAGIDGAMAGTTHGLRARGAGLAITSKKAGSTQCMNAYGFGTPTREQTLGYYKTAEEEAKEALKGAKSRAERRAATEWREPPPRHKMVMVDMPGYGLGSEESWGVQIAKYLGKRKVLKGAVLLIDAVAGVKEADRMVLEMLRDHDVRTAVVLTKVDKLSGEADPERAEKRVEEVCLSVWDELRRVEQASLTWLEGTEKGWETEIWVTGAGDPNSAALGVAGARWAICRMAGLVEDNRVLMIPGLVNKPVQKIVSFDQIKFAAVSTGKHSRLATF